MKHIFPIAAMISTAGATLVMLVFSLAGAANASAAQIRAMKLSAGGLSVFAVACLAAGLVFMRKGRPVRAAAIAFLPTIVMGVLFLIAIFS